MKSTKFSLAGFSVGYDQNVPSPAIDRDAIAKLQEVVTKKFEVAVATVADPSYPGYVELYGEKISFNLPSGLSWPGDSDQILSNLLDTVIDDFQNIKTTPGIISKLIRELGLKLDNLGKFLMSDPFITIDILADTILRKRITKENEIWEEILNQINGPLQAKKREFYSELVIRILQKQKISFSITSGIQTRLADEALKLAWPLINPDQKIVDLFYQMTRIGDLPLLVEQYLTEIKISNPEASLKNEMVRFLLDLKLDFSITDPTQTYDEFFGQAYIHALKVESGREDPIDKIYSPGSISGWNFEVDYFTTAERQGISPDNILAAGALDYIYELGDNLGIFRVTDALVLMWAQGRLELSQARYNNRVVVNGIVEGDAASRLYRYYKLRDSRLTYEERAMIYKQVLNKGQANLLSRMNPNTDFTLLWEQLMSEVVDFIGKSEKHFSFDNMVSRSSLYQSTQNLQYNLTFNMVGKPLNDVHEMYAQLQECISILGHAEIVDQLSGGGIKNMWTVVDKVSRQELGFAPNISASRTAAVEGHKIFKWISGFDENSVDDQVFKNFVNSAEAYIIAKGQTTEQRSPLLMEGNGSNGVSAGIEDSDEFADWD